MRTTALEVSRNNFIHNYNKIKEYLDNKAIIMPVIKGNGYGTYINKDIELMNRFSIVAVAIVDEAIELRKNGFKNDIFVLNQPYIEELDEIIDNNIIVGISSFEFLNEVINRKLKLRCHIELETGMGRCGVLEKDLDKFIFLIRNSDILVEGVYSHLSSADIDYDYTKKQINVFSNGVLKIKKYFPNIKYIHCQASNGLLNFDLGICNTVRPGIILYGYPASKSFRNKIDLLPVAKLKSKISYIKEVNIGDAISYGRSFVADRKLKVATVGCGYADGIRRELSNKGKVNVLGNYCPILGKVCMDSFMIDVSKVKDVKVGDDVYILDNNLITLESIAYDCNTINYEILSTISDRVPRKFID